MNLEITDRYENRNRETIPTAVLLNLKVLLISQGDDGCLPLDNPGRHRDEDEDCTKGKSSFTNHGHRLDQ